MRTRLLQRVLPPASASISTTTMMRAALLTLALIGWVGTARAQTKKTQTAPAQAAQALPKKTNITRGYKIISGDIQVPEGYSPEAAFELNSWPGGVVFYEFDDNVTQANRDAMRAAMRVWTPGTSLVFREGRGRISLFEIYIHIQNSTGNNSAIGMVLGGQIMNIASWGTQFIIVHELGHALGLQHEHERPDRDNFVQINNNNVQAGRANQFTRLSNQTLVYGPYDFDSIMHYSQCSFSIGCGVDGMGNPITNCTNCNGQQTITVRPPFNTQLSPAGVPWPAAIGQRTHLSYLDGITMMFLYPRGDYRFVNGANTGIIFENGSFILPYKRLATGVAATPQRGTLWIQPGIYTDVSLLNKPMTLRAPLGGVTIRPRMGFAGGPTVASVSAASYNGELAAEAMAAAFGENLSAETAAATSLPLPTTLAGVTVKITDSEGTERVAPLFFVSPSQINYQVPAGASAGVASIAVYNGDSVAATGEIAVVAASPGLFSANSSGEGAPAALLLRVRGDEQSYEPLARYDQEQQRFVPVPIDPGPEGDQLFLILFGTGFRASGSSSAVSANIGDEEAEVLFTGAAPGFAGLDQANVRLPRSLAGRGEVSIVLTADNRSSNAVTINIR